jgi:hypothetical protein
MKLSALRPAPALIAPRILPSRAVSTTLADAGREPELDLSRSNELVRVLPVRTRCCTHNGYSHSPLLLRAGVLQPHVPVRG